MGQIPFELGVITQSQARTVNLPLSLTVRQLACVNWSLDVTAPDFPARSLHRRIGDLRDSDTSYSSIRFTGPSSGRESSADPHSARRRHSAYHPIDPKHGRGQLRRGPAGGYLDRYGKLYGGIRS